MDFPAPAQAQVVVCPAPPLAAASLTHSTRPISTGLQGPIAQPESFQLNPPRAGGQRIPATEILSSASLPLTGWVTRASGGGPGKAVMLLTP